ncbi:MAG: hypothetical protein JWM42_2607 [Burkholderia sp.]|nr:hypothetical protein [Burkholderia sp.]
MLVRCLEAVAARRQVLCAELPDFLSSTTLMPMLPLPQSTHHIPVNAHAAQEPPQAAAAPQAVTAAQRHSDLFQGPGPLQISGPWMSHLKSELPATSTHFLNSMLDYFTGKYAVEGVAPEVVEGNKLKFPLRLHMPGIAAPFPSVHYATCTRNAQGEIVHIDMALAGGQGFQWKKPENLQGAASASSATRETSVHGAVTGSVMRARLLQQAAVHRQSTLRDKFKGMGFLPSQVDELEKGNAGALAALTPEKYDDLVKKMGFMRGDLVRMVQHQNGEQTINTLTTEKVGELKRLGFVNSAIVRMADHECGADVLNALTPDKVAEVKALGFAAKQIEQMADHPCGVQVLHWLTKENVVALKRELNDKANIATECVTHILMSNLKEMGFTEKEAATLRKRSSLPLLKALTQEKVDQLKSWGLTAPKDLIGLLGSKSGAQLLQALTQEKVDQLKSWGLTAPKDLIGLLGTGAGAQLLQALTQEKVLAYLSGAADAAASSPSGAKRKMPDATGTRVHARKRGKVKQEAGPDSLNWDAFPPASVQEGREQIQLNTAQVLHVPTFTRAVIEVDGEGGHKIVADIVRDMDNAFTEHQRQQTYNRDLEKRFPIRDPANPEHVHPLYADPNDPTRVAKGVSIKGVDFYKATSSQISEGTLWQYAMNDGTPYHTKALYIEALKRSVMEEVKATIDGRDPPSCQSIAIEPIKNREQCDSLEEYQATKDQLGAFLTNYAKEQQPTLRNARLGCMFAAAKLATDEDDAAYLARTGAEFGLQMLSDYAAGRKVYGKQDQITWAPHGGGNMAQYFNTSFKKKTINGKDVLVCDLEGVTAMLVPITLTLTDKDGVERKESMLGIVITKTIEEGKQPKLDYGPKYKVPCKTDRPDAMPIKTEPLDDQDIVMTEAPRAA